MIVVVIVIALVFIISGWSKLIEAKAYMVEAEELKKKAQELEDKAASVISANKKMSELKEDIENLKSELQLLADENFLGSSHSEIDIDMDGTTSSEIKNKLALLKMEQKNCLLDNGVKTPYNLKTRDSNRLRKKILTPFESEVTSLINKMTLANADSTRSRIIKVYEKLNKLYEDEDTLITDKYLKLKLKELDLNIVYLTKLNDEKEQQKAIKEQMVEEEKVRREIEREKKKVDKELSQFNAEINKLMSYLNKADSDISKNLYVEKIKELELKIKELEQVKADVLNRELNTRSGYVYIISNIGSFGDDVYKIGVTRRLEPMDRIKELSSASVPFDFDVHAMIFSDDAPALENTLHKTFREYEVNKVNSRKEFFKLPIEKIEETVLKEHNNTVEFTQYAKAEQYRKSLELST